MVTLVCPICGKEVTVACKQEAPYRPFCSERCKRVDLGRWLSEAYVISEALPDGPTAEPNASPAEDDADQDPPA